MVKKALEVTKRDLNDLEQYGRRDCVEIHGIPQEIDENVEKLVTKTGLALDIELEARDIQACHRIGRKQDSPIICKFANRKTPTEFLKARKKAKNPLKGAQLGMQDIKSEFRVFINESLTKQNKELMYLVRGKKREVDWKFVWSRNGTIYARKNEQSEYLRINNEQDIEKMN